MPTKYLTASSGTSIVLESMEPGQSETEDSLRVVREFLSALAHDLNNLLTEIVMLNELLLEELPANHPGRVDVVASRLAALRATELTRRLLAFASEFGAE